MRDCAVLLTIFNRPKLVQDAIASILGQDCDRWHVYLLDDGSNDETRAAIAKACGVDVCYYEQEVAGGITTTNQERSITWWRGPRREMAERKASLSYAKSINICLGNLLRDEQYVLYLCDDDVLLPGSIKGRIEYMDAHPEAHVVYGKLRSVQYGKDGFNTWSDSVRPQAGCQFVEPDGECVMDAQARNGRHYYADGKTDPETGLPYVELGYYRPGPMRYGLDGSVDHNQYAHRVECLRTCVNWAPYKRDDGSIEYWGESLHYGVADAEFCRRLATVHEFIGVDCWAVSKKYHACSDGISSAEVRE